MFQAFKVYIKIIFKNRISCLNHHTVYLIIIHHKYVLNICKQIIIDDNTIYPNFLSYLILCIENRYVYNI